MHSIFTARLILNIRRAANQRRVEIDTQSEMVFPHPREDNTFMELDILPASEVKRNSSRTNLGDSHLPVWGEQNRGNSSVLDDSEA